MNADFIRKIYNQPHLTAEAYEEISRSHTPVEFSKGTLLIKEAKTSNAFYLIEKGLCRSYLIDCNGKDVTTGFYSSEQILIDSFSLFQRKPSRENFEGVSPGIAWKIDYEAFDSMLKKHEGLREWGRLWATQELYNMKRRSLDLLTVSATDRYLALIEQQPDILLYAPLKYIASYLGVTDSSLSRIRKDIAGL